MKKFQKKTEQVQQCFDKDPLFLSMFFGSLIPLKALLPSIQQRKDHNTTPFSLSLSLHQKEKIIDREFHTLLVFKTTSTVIMETHHQKNTENDVEKQNEEGATKPPSSSPSSSPSHEFSFTISLHSSNTTLHDKSKPPPSSLAVDLSPADEIFFHGHLLPLHLLSHFSSSPRFSTNSVDSFTLPIRDFLEDEKRNSSSRSNITIDSISNSSISISKEDFNNNRVTKEDNKSNSKTSFSLFGLSKGRKGCQVRDREEDKENNSKHKKKLGYDVMHALKKYLRMVQPLVLFKGRREKVQFHEQAYSHSGNLIRKNKPELRGRRGEYSAPASMRTSPTNSGLLLATTALPPPNDSTMEELQAAIQAAIAHCKNSIAKEEKLNC